MQNAWNAWVWVKWKAGTPPAAWEDWKENPSVKRAWSTQGEWDCCLELSEKDHDRIESFVWENVRGNEWVDTTRTMWAKDWW